MIRRLDHIGIAVDGLEKRLPFWAEALGLKVSAIETVNSERVKVAFLPTAGTRIELLEATSEDSPIAKHLERRGPGVHHLTFAVDDLDAALAKLGRLGLEVIGGGARRGAGGHRVAFLHPRGTGGVLVELCDAPADVEAEADVVPGSPILLYLRDPPEKMWGLLRRLDVTGVTIEGIDLNSFEDWLAQLDSEEESIAGPSTVFLPIGRVEKILLDQPSGSLPSLAQRVETRAGHPLHEVIARRRGR
jgi:methylmalonyl-CoA epimerase